MKRLCRAPEEKQQSVQQEPHRKAAETDKQGNVSLDQEELVAKLGADATTLIQRPNEFRSDFALPLLRRGDIQFNKAFVWMLRAQLNPQPEDPRLTKSRRRGESPSRAPSSWPQARSSTIGRSRG